MSILVFAGRWFIGGGWKIVAIFGIVVALFVAFEAHSHARFKAGQADRDAYWTGQNARDREAQQKELGLQIDRARAAESLAQTNLAAASAGYQKGLRDGHSEVDRRIALLDADGLRVDLKPGTCSAGGAVPGASAATSGRDGGASALLSREASERLIRYAGDADDVARQLAACQAVVRADRGT